MGGDRQFFACARSSPIRGTWRPRRGEPSAGPRPMRATPARRSCATVSKASDWEMRTLTGFGATAATTVRRASRFGRPFDDRQRGTRAQSDRTVSVRRPFRSRQHIASAWKCLRVLTIGGCTERPTRVVEMQVIERHGFDVVTSPCKRGQHIEQRPAVDQGESFSNLPGPSQGAMTRYAS